MLVLEPSAEKWIFLVPGVGGGCPTVPAPLGYRPVVRTS